MEQAKYDVFISYSRKDYVDDNGIPILGNPVSAIEKMFSENGITYRLDKGFPTCCYYDFILDEIKRCRMFLFVSSRNSNESELKCIEILAAHKANKIIIPIKIDDCPYKMSSDLFSLPINFAENPNNALIKLLQVVHEKLQKIQQQ